MFNGLPTLPPRAAAGHKGDFGRVLILGGSRGLSGAACLAGMAALRGGAGLVRVAVPAGILPSVAAYEPSYLTAPLVEDAQGRIGAQAREQIFELIEANDVVALGPGLGRSPELIELVGELYRGVDRPMVVDADALNALAPLSAARVRPAQPRILTPHPGEFARLAGIETQAVQEQRAPRAQEFAAQHQVVLVLKGQGTVVTDGRQLWVNPTGNPGMATGGSGDVLTGLIAALVGQGLAAYTAAQLGAYVHGLAGDLAAKELGQTALIASDLLKYLPAALRQVGG